jgi:hypothetical protein
MDPLIWMILGVVGAGFVAAITQDVWRWIADRLIDLISR